MENTVIIPEIERVATEAQIEPDGIVALQAKFSPHFQAFAALYPEAKEVQADEPKKARALRLKVRAVRLAADETRKEMKADSLRRSKAIDGVNNVLLLALTPVEEALEKIEKAEEIREANRKRLLVEERTKALEPYTTTPAMFNLGEMEAGQFNDLLASLKATHLAKIAAAEAAEKARQEAALAAEAERMRVLMENARLEKLAADERAAREDAERKASAERAEAARLAKIESDKRDAAERAQREKERKERAEAESKAAAALAKERAERARIQAEIDAKAKADAERIAKEKAAAKKAAAAPDQEKIRAYADAIANLVIPSLNDSAIYTKIQEQSAAMHRWLVTLSNKIGE
jgi:hypothetical protein